MVAVLATLVMTRSALAFTVIVSVDRLFDGVGSAVVVVTVLVALTCVAGTVKVTCWLTVWPGVSVPTG